MTTLYTTDSGLDSHRVRFVLAKKGIAVEILDVDIDVDKIADLAELNPYNETPTLADRDLVLYGARVITEYLDERYPHPPLMPVDPVSRGRLRLVHYRIMRDWYSLARQIETAGQKKVDQCRKQLREGLIAANELFTIADYLMNDEITLVDCSLAPLLWRLPAYSIKLDGKAPALEAYMDRIFARDSFIMSLTEAEREMHGILS